MAIYHALENRCKLIWGKLIGRLIRSSWSSIKYLTKIHKLLICYLPKDSQDQLKGIRSFQGYAMISKQSCFMFYVPLLKYPGMKIDQKCVWYNFQIWRNACHTFSYNSICRNVKPKLYHKQFAKWNLYNQRFSIYKKNYDKHFSLQKSSPALIYVFIRKHNNQGSFFFLKNHMLSGKCRYVNCRNKGELHLNCQESGWK